jgi:hypothetical protein
MEALPTGTRQKALALNLDKSKYGTIAEIGAGQEVARWFFLVGGAAGTIAKSVSAYDMAVSDAMYGSAQRYVSRPRLQAMLEHEFSQLLERLGPAKGDGTTFFVFADTVATRSYAHHDDGRGWVGVRFQTHPREAPSDVIVHVHLKDTTATRQQEALGVLGVNLIHGAYYRHAEPEDLIGSLLDELTRERVAWSRSRRCRCRPPGGTCATSCSRAAIWSPSAATTSASCPSSRRTFSRASGRATPGGRPWFPLSSPRPSEPSASSATRRLRCEHEPS